MMVIGAVDANNDKAFTSQIMVQLSEVSGQMIKSLNTNCSLIQLPTKVSQMSLFLYLSTTSVNTLATGEMAHPMAMENCALRMATHSRASSLMDGVMAKVP